MKAFYLLTSAILLMFSCTGKKNNAPPVTGFNAARYLGKWYEAARLPNTFQKNMVDCSAEYAAAPGGKIKVINRGYHSIKKEWKQAEGIAKFTDSDTTGLLRVSFFRPFWGTYKIMRLGEDYEYALVVGDDFSYLWVLSREPVMDREKLDGILKQAQAAGFNLDKIIINQGPAAAVTTP